LFFLFLSSMALLAWILFISRVASLLSTNATNPASTTFSNASPPATESAIQPLYYVFVMLALSLSCLVLVLLFWITMHWNLRAEAKHCSDADTCSAPTPSRSGFAVAVPQMVQIGTFSAKSAEGDGDHSVAMGLQSPRWNPPLSTHHAAALCDSDSDDIVVAASAGPCSPSYSAFYRLAPQWERTLPLPPMAPVVCPLPYALPPHLRQIAPAALHDVATNEKYDDVAMANVDRCGATNQLVLGQEASASESVLSALSVLTVSTEHASDGSVGSAVGSRFVDSQNTACSTPTTSHCPPRSASSVCSRITFESTTNTLRGLPLHNEQSADSEATPSAGKGTDGATESTGSVVRQLAEREEMSLESDFSLGAVDSLLVRLIVGDAEDTALCSEYVD